MKKVNGMESKRELNAKTKILMSNLANEPKQLTDKIEFIKCVSRYMYLYKDDLEILQRALSQLKIYAPISKEEWKNDELINQLIDILENVNAYLKKNDKEPFKLLSQPLIEWLDNDGFIVQDTVRMKEAPSLINKSLTNYPKISQGFIYFFMVYRKRCFSINVNKWENNSPTTYL